MNITTFEHIWNTMFPPDWDGADEYDEHTITDTTSARLTMWLLKNV